MSKIVVTTNLTLDGVAQAPARPDEDTRGGFPYGGWAKPYADASMGRIAASGIANAGGLLFGRRTYQDFFAVWPQRKDNPFTEVLNNFPKYVVSNSLDEPLPWSNSTLLRGEVNKTVRELKEKPGKDLVVLGSITLVRSLLRHNLVDEYVLSIHPLVLGTGSRLFEGPPRAGFRLVNTVTTDSGVVMATYAPADSPAR